MIWYEVKIKVSNIIDNEIKVAVQAADELTAAYQAGVQAQQLYPDQVNSGNTIQSVNELRQGRGKR